MHCDHCGLLFFNIEELNQALLQRVVEVHNLGLWDTVHLLISRKAGYVLLLESNQTLVNDEERSLNPTRVCVETKLSVLNVSHNGNFFRDLHLSSQIED